MPSPSRTTGRQNPVRPQRGTAVAGYDNDICFIKYRFSVYFLSYLFYDPAGFFFYKATFTVAPLETLMFVYGAVLIHLGK